MWESGTAAGQRSSVVVAERFDRRKASNVSNETCFFFPLLVQAPSFCSIGIIPICSFSYVLIAFYRRICSLPQ